MYACVCAYGIFLLENATAWKWRVDNDGDCEESWPPLPLVKSEIKQRKRMKKS